MCGGFSIHRGFISRTINLPFGVRVRTPDNIMGKETKKMNKVSFYPFKIEQHNARIPEWPKGGGLRPPAKCFVGSNPTSSTYYSKR